MGTLDILIDGEARTCGACGADLTAPGSVAARYQVEATGRFRPDGAGYAFREAAGTPTISGQMGPAFRCRACGGLLVPSTTVQVERDERTAS